MSASRTAGAPYAPLRSGGARLLARLGKNTSRSSAPGVPALAGAAAVLAASAPPRFYPDDPIWVDDDKALDASKAGAVEDSNGYDFVVNTFAEPGERRDVRALNVNTVDEVPDSSWFTNRIGRRQMSVDEIVRGPDRCRGVSLDGWIVSGGQVHRRAARLPDDGSEGGLDLSDRVRSAVESGDGDRRRDHRHGVLPRLRLSHGRGVPRRARSGEGRDRADAPRSSIR